MQIADRQDAYATIDVTSKNYFDSRKLKPISKRTIRWFNEESHEMSMPSREVLIPCPSCGLSYFISQRASIRLSRRGFEEAYINEATASICPHCGFRADLRATASNFAQRISETDFI
jgi:transposase